MLKITEIYDLNIFAVVNFLMIFIVIFEAQLRRNRYLNKDVFAIFQVLINFNFLFE
jgi:hypothetical protein